MILYETAAASQKSKHWPGNFKAIISEKMVGDVRCFRHHLYSGEDCHNQITSL